MACLYQRFDSGSTAISVCGHLKAKNFVRDVMVNRGHDPASPTALEGQCYLCLMGLKFVCFMKASCGWLLCCGSSQAAVGHGRACTQWGLGVLNQYSPTAFWLSQRSRRLLVGMNYSAAVSGQHMLQRGGSPPERAISAPSPRLACACLCVQQTEGLSVGCLLKFFSFIYLRPGGCVCRPTG